MKLYYILIFIVLTSCYKEDKIKTINKTVSNKEVKVKLDTLKIPIDGNKLSYYLFSSFSRKKECFVGYNYTKHSLDFFNINTGVYLKTVQLEKEGPNGIFRLEAMDYYDDDNIFIANINFIYRINSLGEIVEKIAVNNPDKDPFYKKNTIYFNNYIPFKYFKERNELLVNIVNLENDYSKDPKNHFANTKPFGIYNIKTKKITNYNIHYPKEYAENYFGYCDELSIDKSNEKLTYSFQSVPDLFEYNLKTEKITRYKLYDSDLPNVRLENIGWNQGSNSDAKMKLSMTNSFFGPIFRTDKYLFQFYTSGMPNDAVDITDIEKKKFLVNIYDNELNYLSKINIDRVINPRITFLKEDDLYLLLPANSKVEEDYLTFLKISIQ